MEIEVLGCFGGVDIKHNPVTFLVDGKYLLDGGSIVKELSLERQQKIQGVFITHCHLDHIKDLCFLADNLVLLGKGPVNVYGLSEVLDMLKKYVMNNKIWPDFFEIKSKKGDSILNLMPVSTGLKVSLNRTYTIELVKTDHSCESAAYILGKNNKYIAYTGDTGPTERLWQRINEIPNVKAVFIEISFPNRMRELALVTGHLTPELFIEETKKLRNSEKIKFYIFHMKPPLLDEIKKEICCLNMDNVVVLDDGDILRI